MYITVKLTEQREVVMADYWTAPEFVVPLLVQLVQIPLLWLLLRHVDARKNAHSDQPGCLARRVRLGTVCPMGCVACRIAMVMYSGI